MIWFLPTFHVDLARPQTWDLKPVTVALSVLVWLVFLLSGPTQLPDKSGWQAWMGFWNRLKLKYDGDPLQPHFGAFLKGLSLNAKPLSHQVFWDWQQRIWSEDFWPTFERQPAVIWGLWEPQSHQGFRWLTWSLVHNDLGHLLNNWVIFVLAGTFVEKIAGSLALVGLFFVASGFSGWFFRLFSDSAAPLIGLSGVVMALMGFIIVFQRGKNVRFWFWPTWQSVHLPVTWLWVTFVVDDLLGWLGLWWKPHGQDAIAYGAHVGGFLAGVVFAFLWRYLRPQEGS